MNIKLAKDEIKNAVLAYSQKDEFGEYLIDRVRQRPILLLGAPGIGKTAIMEQITHELGIGLVAYSITHHTRQSAIGLPFISEREYDGEIHKITEYTMSEIVSSVYDAIEFDGYREGILFIDEINCASETLAPTMLQFLQYKTFGQHRVPDGWTLVAAGNPPEYNKSVREFDVVTLDRLKKIDIEPDFQAWKEYAYKQGVHSAIISYLDIQNNHFYSIESTVDGKEIITARGWEDLSKIIQIYEGMNVPVTEDVVVQYLQHRGIARQFTNYYDLYNKYQNDYRIEEILSGQYEQRIIEKLRRAKFDEKISMISLLTSKIFSLMTAVVLHEDMIAALFTRLKVLKVKLLANPSDPIAVMDSYYSDEHKIYQVNFKNNRYDKREREVQQKSLEFLNQLIQSAAQLNKHDGKQIFNQIREQFNKAVSDKDKRAENANTALKNALVFTESAFGLSQEIVILVTELNLNYYSAKFLSMYDNPLFIKYNKELLFQDKERNILKDIEQLERFDETL